MIQARGLRKVFQDIVAVDGVDVDVPAGHWFLFVGHNGAGKTTTIKMLAGLLPPSAGRVLLAGIDPQKDPIGARRAMGYLPERFEPYDYLTPREYLAFVADVHKIDRAVARKRAEALLALFELDPHASKILRGFSQGMRKKVGLAAAMIHDPQVLFLDEPTATLDPPTSHLVRKVLRGFCAEGRTVFMSTHILGLAERECDRIGVLHRGRISLLATPDELAASHPGKSLEEVVLELTGGLEQQRIDTFFSAFPRREPTPPRASDPIAETPPRGVKKTG